MACILGQTYDAVIIVGPSHRAAFHGISIYDEGGYETPLGVVSVDKTLAGRIRAATTCVVASPLYHDAEHAIEIQLPFLQSVLKDVRFVPVMMGQQDPRDMPGSCKIESLRRPRTGRFSLLPVPICLITTPTVKLLKWIECCWHMLREMILRGLLRALACQDGEACGGGPMAVAMMAAARMGSDRAVVLKYLNSGDVTGDKSGVVGYAAAVCFRHKEQ